jgi:chlorobactene glucosyltransferase
MEIYWLVSPLTPIDWVIILLTIPLLLLAGIALFNCFWVRTPYGTPLSFPKISVLIPLRNEEKNIDVLLPALLSTEYPEIEFILLDDQSIDSTLQKIKNYSIHDSRIKIITGKTLAEGWTGKNYACHQLAKQATGNYYLFMDADVIPSANAISATISTLISHKLDFLTVFPKQIMPTALEKEIIPWIDFFLYTFLPISFITWFKSPFLTAANGQWMFFKKEAYEKIGGHEKVKNTIVEDIALARNINKSGLKMRLFTGGNLIQCRMYLDASALRAGFSKNVYAAAGYSSLNLIVFLSILFTLFVMPWIGIFFNLKWVIPLSIILLIKLSLGLKFKHPLLHTLFLHPISFIKALEICLYSLQVWKNKTVQWKGRNLNA